MFDIRAAIEEVCEIMSF